MSQSKNTICGYFLAAILSLIHTITFASDGRQGAPDLSEVGITLHLSQTSLRVVIRHIQEQTDFNIAYDQSQIDPEEQVSVDVTDQSLKDVLDKLSAGRFSYQLRGKTILLLPPKEDPGSKTLKGQQPGKLTGQVLDESTGESLVGATVRIEGVSLGAVTDIDGNFELLNVAPGTYNLIISFIGYGTNRIPNVMVTADKVTTLNISLNEQASELEAVVIVGDLDVKYAPIENSTETTMVESIRAETGIVTGISNEQISRSLDRDASDVVKRIVGVTVMDKFTMIRGLHPRYTATLLDNSLAPSTDMDRRDFSYDLLPSGVIDQITVYKTPAPELPGMFAGGVIKIKTKSAIPARRIQVSISSQYRTGGSSFADTYSYSGTSSKDWYTGGLEDRRVSPELYDLDYKFPLAERYPEENAALMQASPLHNLTSGHHNVDKRMGINYYDSWKLGEKVRLNNLTSVSYTNQASRRIAKFHFRDGKYIYAADVDSFVKQNSDQDFTDTSYYHSVRISAMQNLSLQLGENHRLSFNNFYNRMGDDETNVRTGFKEEKTLLYKYFNYFYSLSELYSGGLSGNHQFPGLGLSADWMINSSMAYQQAPDYQRTTYTGQDSVHWEMLVPESVDHHNRRGNITIDESANLATLDVEKKLPFDITLKLGGLYQQKEREMVSLNYQTRAGQRQGVSSNTGRQPWTVLDSIFSTKQFSPEGFYMARLSGYGVYSVDDVLYAGYVGLGVSFLKNKIPEGRLKLYGGMRYEHNLREIYDFNAQNVRQETFTVGGVTYPIERLKPEYLLPSFNISYSFSPQMLVRVAYGKTLDRPNYREMSQFRFFDYKTNRATDGNPLLKNAEIDNYDLRYEWYPAGEGEFVAIGAFYKKLDNAIEVYDVTSPAAQGTSLWTYMNTKRVEVKGVELELRKSLANTLDALKHFSMIANATYNVGSVENAEVTIFGQTTGSSRAGVDNRLLQGLSPYIVNAGLYFDNKKGTQISAMYNISGQRVIINGVAQNPPAYELPRHVIDLTFKQRINQYLEIKGGVQDLLNQAFRIYRDESLNGKYDPENYVQRGKDEKGNKYRDYFSSWYKKGSYFSLGLTATF